MALTLYAHPFSSYCQKVLIALYENGTPFTYGMLEPGHPAAAEFAELWPLKRMPLLRDGDRTVMEATIMVEYLDLAYPGRTRFLPEDRMAALAVRQMDRIFDNYVMTPMQRIVADFIRPPDTRDPPTVTQANALLDAAYAWLDRELGGREWAAPAGFSLADCAAAPALFYAAWVRPIPESLAALTAYRRRLLARPSFARAVEEARPYRHYFPPGAPERD